MITPAYYDFDNGRIVKAEDAFISTSDATVTTLATITPEEVDAIGFLEVFVFAVCEDGGYSLLGKKLIHWRIDTSVTTIINVKDDVADSLYGLTTATWTVDADGGDLRVRVTGEAATNLLWKVYYRVHSQEITVAPP